MSLPDEELLSAYLDGELSADERSRVERLLAESPESRQLLEELRSIRASLERMPRARLGQEFADQVLRQAEKEFLTAGGDGGPAKSQGEKPRLVRASEPAETAEPLARIPWQRFRRPAIWASLALAAGLLIMFLDRERFPPAGRQVAMAPGEEPALRARAQQEQEGLERQRDEIGAPAGPTPSDSLGQPSEAPKEPASETRSYYSRSELSTGGARPAPAAAPPMAGENRPPAAAAAGGRAMPRAAGKPVQADSGKEANGALAEEKMEGVEEQIDQKDGLAHKIADGGRHFLAAGNNTLIVWCDVAPGTNYSESFRELLAEQNIRWEAEAEMAETGVVLGREWKAQTAQKTPADNRPAAKVPAESEPADDQVQLGLNEQSRLKRLSDAEQAVLDANSEVVLVEAGQPQIEAVLAAVDGAASVFVNVDVETPPDAPRQQQQLQRFARGTVSREKLGELTDDAAKQSKKRDELLDKRAAKPAAGEANQSQSAAGTARRLTVRPAPPSDETASNEQKKGLPQLMRSQADNELAKEKKSTETPSFGLGRLSQQAAGQDRFQVLFVLHPVEASGTPAEAKPAGDND